MTPFHSFALYFNPIRAVKTIPFPRHFDNLYCLPLLIRHLVCHKNCYKLFEYQNNNILKVKVINQDFGCYNVRVIVQNAGKSASVISPQIVNVTL